MIEKLSLNKSWRFFRGEFQGQPQAVNFNDTDWEVVTVPHTVRVEPAICSGGVNYQGISWYRKRFYLEEASQGKKIWIEFEGAKHIAEVWLNGHKLGTHFGGYLPFTFEISEQALIGDAQENVLVVKLNNYDQPDIPPGKPQDTLDFCYFGGLYRNVWLYETEKVYITDPVYANEVASGGIFVRTTYADADKAKLSIQVHLKNELEVDKQLSIDHYLYHQEEVVATGCMEVRVNRGQAYAQIQTLEVQNPQLWHPDTPNLYTLKTVVREGDKIYDEEKTTIGIRTISFSGEGFKINGRELKILGTNKSQEYVYIGDALSDTLHEREVRTIKEAGFNAIRTGHYPCGRALMEACDKLGMLCIVPIPGWQWFKDESLFKERSYQNLRDLIRAYRNHPSIILWEPILNETRYTEEYAKTTYAITHEEYPGDQCYAASDAYLAAAEIYDVPYGNEKNTLRPDQCCFIREYGDNYREQFGPQKTIKRCNRGDRGFYPGGEKAMTQSAIERMVQADRLFLHKQIAGGAIWTGIDCNRGYIDNLASAGVLDLYRLPKFSYYVYQSQNSPEPMIFAATYWKEKTNPLVVFSNCEEVAVYVNNKLVGRQKVNRDYLEREDVLKSASHFVTGVINCVAYEMVDDISKGLKHPPFVFEKDLFEDGELRVEGLIDDVVVVTQKITTPRAPKKIRLELAHHSKELVADGADCVMVHAFIEDEAGMLVPDAYNEITFTVEGPAIIIGDQIERVGSNPVQAEAGAIGILVQSTYEEGSITVRAKAEGLETGTIIFSSIKDPKKYVLGAIEKEPLKPIVYEVDACKVARKISFSEFDWAKDKKVQASSYEEAHEPERMVDSEQDTSWRAKSNTAQWLIVDLEESVDLTGCKIWWESDNTDYHYEVHVSGDGESWEKVIAKVGTGQDMKPDTFSADQKRYVKIVISGVSKGVPEICSFQVFGVKG